MTNAPAPNRTAKYAPPKWCKHPYIPAHRLGYCWGWATAIDEGLEKAFKKLCRTCEYRKEEEK